MQDRTYNRLGIFANSPTRDIKILGTTTAVGMLLGVLASLGDSRSMLCNMLCGSAWGVYFGLVLCTVLHIVNQAYKNEYNQIAEQPSQPQSTELQPSKKRLGFFASSDTRDVLVVGGTSIFGGLLGALTSVQNGSLLCNFLCGSAWGGYSGLFACALLYMLQYYLDGQEEVQQVAVAHTA